MMRQAGISLLTLANILSFLGIFYYFVPGYPHLFAGGATGSQGNLGFVCIALFVFCFLTAVQITPSPHEQHEAGTCWACGNVGRSLVWWTIEPRGPATNRTRPLALASNQRVSYLIHPQCEQLAQKQAGL